MDNRLQKVPGLPGTLYDVNASVCFKNRDTFEDKIPTNFTFLEIAFGMREIKKLIICARAEAGEFKAAAFGHDSQRDTKKGTKRRGIFLVKKDKILHHLLLLKRHTIIQTIKQ